MTRKTLETELEVGGSFILARGFTGWPVGAEWEIYLDYAGMPSKDVFSMVYRDHRDGGSRNFFYPISKKEIRYKNNKIKVLDVNPERIKLGWEEESPCL